MKLRFIVASLAIHLACVMLATKQEQAAPHPENETAVELVEEAGPALEKKSGRDVDIIEMNEFGDKKEIKDHYWGLGIQGQHQFYQGDYCYMVTKVYSGYNGEASGLQEGDAICKVNGKSPVVEDISGAGPKKLMLVILRVDKFSGMVYSVKIETERGKVYF